MSRMSILNAPGQQTEGFCMVKSAALRTDSKGGAYMDMVLADAGGECVAKIWNYGPSMGMFEPEDIVKVRGTVTIWKDSEQLNSCSRCQSLSRLKLGQFSTGIIARFLSKLSRSFRSSYKSSYSICLVKPTTLDCSTSSAFLPQTSIGSY